MLSLGLRMQPVKIHLRLKLASPFRSFLQPRSQSYLQGDFLATSATSVVSYQDCPFGAFLRGETNSLWDDILRIAFFRSFLGENGIKPTTEPELDMQKQRRLIEAANAQKLHEKYPICRYADFLHNVILQIPKVVVHWSPCSYTISSPLDTPPTL